MALASWQIRNLCMTAGKTTPVTGSNVWRHLALPYQHARNVQSSLDESMQVRLVIAYSTLINRYVYLPCLPVSGQIATCLFYVVNTPLTPKPAISRQDWICATAQNNIFFKNTNKNCFWCKYIVNPIINVFTEAFFFFEVSTTK